MSGGNGINTPVGRFVREYQGGITPMDAGNHIALEPGLPRTQGTQRGCDISYLLLHNKITPKMSDLKWQWTFIISHNFCGSGILERPSWVVWLGLFAGRREDVTWRLDWDWRVSAACWQETSVPCTRVSPRGCLSVPMARHRALSRASDPRRNKAELQYLLWPRLGSLMPSLCHLIFTGSH